MRPLLVILLPTLSTALSAVGTLLSLPDTKTIATPVTPAPPPKEATLTGSPVALPPWASGPGAIHRGEVEQHIHGEVLLHCDEMEQHLLDTTPSNNFLPSKDALVHFVPVRVFNREPVRVLRLHVRQWGLPVSAGGIPLLFVHGGPGAAVEDYAAVNEKLFGGSGGAKFWVIEVDQRGTGKSTPSVR